ncbi:hypothetical protein P2318_02655 [Myxococcaceae bacterium GXIMD 01537]
MSMLGGGQQVQGGMEGPPMLDLAVFAGERREQLTRLSHTVLTERLWEALADTKRVASARPYGEVCEWGAVEVEVELEEEWEVDIDLMS